MKNVNYSIDNNVLSLNVQLDDDFGYELKITDSNGHHNFDINIYDIIDNSSILKDNSDDPEHICYKFNRKLSYIPIRIKVDNDNIEISHKYEDIRTKIIVVYDLDKEKFDSVFAILNDTAMFIEEDGLAA